MHIFQKGFHFGQDGPGNRLVYHVAGCNLRCLWCANPEGMAAAPGQEMLTPEEILEEALGCRPMFFSGGGVTFTGGEATLQGEELEQALALLQRAGIHTAIETNGTSPLLSRIWQRVDYLIMDVKHVSDEKLLAYTGAEGGQIRENYRLLCESGRQGHIRIPIVREFNGDGAEEIAAFLASYPTQSLVFEFLPYHEYGKEKWKTPYQIRDGFVSGEELNAFRRAFAARGLVCITT